MKRIFRSWFALFLAIMLALTLPAVAADDIELIGVHSIPGDALDLSGESTILQNGEPGNRLGGISALEWTGDGNRYLALPDRGPDDGAVEYRCRLHELEITISPGSRTTVSAALVATRYLTDADGRHFTGSSAALAQGETLSHRLDPEAIRWNRGESLFVSEEYGPLLLEFSTTGQMIRSLALPDCFRVAAPSADKVTETLGNSSGRATNRGLECLALTPDGKTLVGLMQGPLIQDGSVSQNGLVTGRNCRLIAIDLASGRTSQFVYQMDSELHGNSELTAVSDTDFLVLERDGLAGDAAQYRRLVRISLNGATDIGDRQQLAPSDIGSSVIPVARRDFLDLLAPDWGLAGTNMPEKIEGLTFGPSLPDGRRSLLIATDNDFESANPTWIWVFAVR